MTEGAEKENARSEEQNRSEPKRNSWPSFRNVAWQVPRKIVTWSWRWLRQFGRGLRQSFDSLNYVSPLLTALATAGIVWIAYWQWDALDRTDQTLRAAQRPWIKYADVQITKGIFYNVSGLNIDLRFVLQNTGNSPAQHVFPQTFTSLNLGDFMDAREQRRRCDLVRKQSMPEFGFTIFPGDHVPQDIRQSASRGDIDQALSRWPANSPINKFVFPVIFGCINYVFPFGRRESHQTGIILQLQRVDPNPPIPGALVGIDTALGDVPASDLRLTISHWGSYAD